MLAKTRLGRSPVLVHTHTHAESRRRAPPIAYAHTSTPPNKHHMQQHTHGYTSVNVRICASSFLLTHTISPTHVHSHVALVRPRTHMHIRPSLAARKGVCAAAKGSTDWRASSTRCCDDTPYSAKLAVASLYEMFATDDAVASPRASDEAEYRETLQDASPEQV